MAMSNGVSGTFIGKEFDDFLFASIGEDPNGMRLCVVSALARLDLDPWHEAASLARLPVDAATRRLASLIAALPDQPSARRDSGPIAARMVMLLPRLASSVAPPFHAIPGISALSRLHPVLVAFLIFVTVVLTSQWLFNGNQTRATRDQGAPTGAVLPDKTTSHQGD